MPRTFTLPRGTIMPHTPLRSDAQIGDARRDVLISVAYANAGRLRTARLDVRHDTATDRVPSRGVVFGEAKTRPLWDGLMTPRLQAREDRTKGTCPDKVR